MRCRDGIRNVAAPMALGIGVHRGRRAGDGGGGFRELPRSYDRRSRHGGSARPGRRDRPERAREFRVGRDGDAFIIVGSALGLLAGTIAIMALIATGMDACLPGGEGRANRDPLEHATLAMLMVLPAAVALRRSLRRSRSLREEVRP